MLAEDKFIVLKQTIESYDFTVKIAPPPKRSTYGLLNTESKTIWINPVVFDLNIAFTHYNHGLRRHLEAEAYAVQTHPQGYQMVSGLLQQHCSN